MFLWDVGRAKREQGAAAGTLACAGEERSSRPGVCSARAATTLEGPGPPAMIRIHAARMPRCPRAQAQRAHGDRISWPAVRLVGINHVALEVGDVDEAVAWYGRFFEFELRGRAGAAMAFIDMGDQFIAIAAGRTQPPDQARHVGLVVDDKEAVRAALRAAGVSVQASGALDFLDPWGNHVQVVDYREIQFSKAPAVLRGMGIGELEKTPAAKQELRRKGLADD